MPFKRAVVLLEVATVAYVVVIPVSMPFKRAVVLLVAEHRHRQILLLFQCPLSGQLCCWDCLIDDNIDDRSFNAL